MEFKSNTCECNSAQPLGSDFKCIFLLITPHRTHIYRSKKRSEIDMEERQIVQDQLTW